MSRCNNIRVSHNIYFKPFVLTKLLWGNFECL